MMQKKVMKGSARSSRANADGLEIPIDTYMHLIIIRIYEIDMMNLFRQELSCFLYLKSHVADV